MIAITLSVFRARLKQYSDAVLDAFDTLIIPRRKYSRKAVVVISLEAYNALTETHFLLANKANRDWLRESIAQEANGETRPLDVAAFGAAAD